MKYLLYEIKNDINGKIYIGVHKTKVEDGYMGSGKVIKDAIKKYGIENFTKTILEEFESQEAMFAKEKEIVDEEFLLRDDTYNLRRGGNGGFDHINRIATKEQKSNSGKLGGLTSKGSIENLKQALTDAALSKRRQTQLKRGTFVGKNNPQFGTMWITNGTECKKIKKDDSIPNGWNRGRKCSSQSINGDAGVL